MISITTCSYKNKAKGKWKLGFAICNGIGVSDVKNIMDLDGNMQGSNIYDYRLTPDAAVILHPVSLIHRVHMEILG